MKHLRIGLSLLCLMLLAACGSTDTWGTWEIRCFDKEYNTWNTQRFEGSVYIPYETNEVYLTPKVGGNIIHNNVECTYTFLGKAGVVNND